MLRHNLLSSRCTIGRWAPIPLRLIVGYASCSMVSPSYSKVPMHLRRFCRRSVCRRRILWLGVRS